MALITGGPVDERFAANVRSTRETLRMSQGQLAEAMARKGFKWHQATVYKVEHAARQVSISEAEALSSIFGVGIDLLVTGGKDAAGALEITHLYQETVEARSLVITHTALWRSKQRELARVLGIEDIWGRSTQTATDTPSPTDAHQESLIAAATESITDVLDAADPGAPFDSRSQDGHANAAIRQYVESREHRQERNDESAS